MPVYNRPPKSDGVYSRYEDFSDIYDLSYQARTRGLDLNQAKQIGLQVAMSGDYLTGNDNRLVSRHGHHGFDPKQSFDPKNAFDPRYAGQYNYGPDVPYPETEEQRYRRRNTPRPGGPGGASF